MTFEEWWNNQVRAREQPDDYAYMQVAKAAWNAAEGRLRFCGYVETGYSGSPADVGSICKVEGGKYRVPVYALPPNYSSAAGSPSNTSS